MVMEMIMMLIIKIMYGATIMDKVTTDIVQIIMDVMFGFKMNPKIRIKIMGIQIMNLNVFVLGIFVLSIFLHNLKFDLTKTVRR